MKKIISTILFLTLLVCTNACRSQEEDLEIETLKKEAPTSTFSKINDSVKTDSLKAVTNSLPTDPPPKNGHQW